MRRPRRRRATRSAPRARPQPAQPNDVSSPAAGAPAARAAAPRARRHRADPGIGQPTGLGLQEQVTPIGQEAAWFHNTILMPLIIASRLFVLFLCSG